MEYSIGEVSSLLNLSRDMIRYYEKQGAIHSKRNVSNNYRVYDVMDVFWLLEAMQHKAWGIPISGISGVRGSGYTENTERFLEERLCGLERDILYKQLLYGRIKELKEYFAYGGRNVGNFWITEMPSSYRFHLVRGRGGDEYDRIDLPEEVSSFVFSEKMTPFITSGLTVRDGCADWEITIEERYVRALSADSGNAACDGKDAVPPALKYCEHVPASPALCTHIDIGEIGQFDPGVFDVLGQYAREHDCKAAEGALIRGLLLGRGIEEDRFRRIVRLYLPII